MITDKEINIARGCIDMALDCGANAVRVSLEKSRQQSISILDGELDKLSYCCDCGLYLNIYADSRYGYFSTNRLDESSLRPFVRDAVKMTKLLAPDPLYSLPAKERKASGCSRGDELSLEDKTYESISPELKKQIALEGSNPGRDSVLSAECEYSDSLEDSLLLDSDGFEGRHIETSFGMSAEVTVEDSRGGRFSSYYWDGATMMKDFDSRSICSTAAAKAAAQIGPRKIKGGKYTVVVDNMVSSRLLGPILNALNASAIQQDNSFLKDSIGKNLFSPNFTLVDKARDPFRAGSRLFDSEGVATAEYKVIDKGVPTMYFTDTYMAAKTGLPPTIEGVSRPLIEPFICNCGENGINLEAILKRCDRGIYITGFNGGNCNDATGNFSYGIEGFLFEGGVIKHPVRRMVMTGNMTDLWNSLVAAGDDPRRCTRWQIPSLAFENIDINA